jgi:diguanylate cyclase (GGDEF)-like protein
MDLDRFKALNDRFGHNAGDQLLVHFASICREEKRMTDVFARIGGEEFSILTPGTSLDHAFHLAERIRY